MKQLSKGSRLAGFKLPAPPPVLPAPSSVGADVPLSYPLALPAPFGPSLASKRAKPQLPMSAFIELDYHCVGCRGVPVTTLAWEPTPPIEIALPRFFLQAVIPSVEQIRTSQRQPRSPAGVVPFRKPKISARRLSTKYGPAAIAASVILFLSVWFGTRPQALKPKVVADASNAAPASGHMNPVAWARNTIEKRATVQVTDTFKLGMAAWGVPKGWVPGWSRHPDGYVHLGQLALFQPTSTFTDYRLEFFGQVEDRGMGWAVRARDPRNYYAMKFKVLASGLRPIWELIYYPVVGGKSGHQVEVPLPAVMTHANTPYHVAVRVSGNRLTTSIEGQEVDSWTDEIEPSGTVGFFTDPGERARLYWMKVYKNDDWLGRVCGFLTGNSMEAPVETARFDRLTPFAPNLPLLPELAILASRPDQLSFSGLEQSGATNPGTAPWNF